MPSFLDRSTRLCALAGATLWLSAGAPAGPPGLPFTQEAASRGVNYPVQNIGQDGFGYGVAFADLDGDGDADLVCLGRFSGVVGVYENDGTGHFIDRSANSGIPPNRYVSGVSAADYDRDGDLDLHITVWTQAHMLLRNDGGFHFTNVAASAGVADTGAGSGDGWGDFDHDGWIDLYVTNRTGTTRVGGSQATTERNRLFRNLGNGTFHNVAAQMGVEAGDDWSFQATFFDIDRDGDADLYLSNDKGTTCLWKNRMWRSDGGHFTDISASSRTDVCMNAMCVAPGDFDGNGYQDLYITNTPDPHNRLLLNQGDGTFTDGTAAAGVESYLVGWGAVFFDYDNDGDLDLYVCNMNGPNRLYCNVGGGVCPDVAEAMGVADEAPSFCVAIADIDNDGDLDLAVSSTGQPLRLYINHEGQRRSWAKFRVRGRTTDTWGIGARVDVRTAQVWRTREIIAGSAYKSQDDLTAHFGLDAATTIDEARITWPGGFSTTLTGLAVNQTYTVTAPPCPADFDRSGFVDSRDFNDFVRAYLAGTVDFNGDGVVNSQDFFDFVNAFFTPCS